MNQSSKAISDQLLARYMAQQTTAAEDAQIEAWKREHDQNEAQLTDFEKIWQLSAAIKPVADEQADLAWQQVKQKIKHSTSNQTPTLPLHSNKWHYYRVAAMLVIGVGIGYLVYMLSNSVKPTEIVLQTQDNTLEYVLPDSSRVFLNRFTTLSLATDFNQTNRQMDLSGEAYFEVQPNLQKPFVIKTPTAQVTVLGTAFNLKATNQEVDLAVTHGKVQLTTKSQKMYLTKNQTAKTLKDSIILQNKLNINTLGYRTGIYIFEQTTLNDVVEALKAGYNVDIKIKNNQLQNCKLTAKFEQETLANTLAIIAETLHLKLTKEGKTFVLDGEGCQP